MRKIIATALVVSTLGFAAAPAPAAAHGRGGAVAGALIGGALLGAAIGASSSARSETIVVERAPRVIYSQPAPTACWDPYAGAYVPCYAPAPPPVRYYAPPPPRYYNYGPPAAYYRHGW